MASDLASPKRPNLLILMSDEHRRDAMGCMGHQIVKTPHLDALAARGVVFENAYTPSPMCVPTRAAVACGDHVHRIGYWDSATPYDGARSSWMHALRDAGVHTASIGKLHFRSTEDDNGFAEEILPMHVFNGVGWAPSLLRKNPPPYDGAAELAADVGVGTSTYTDYDGAIADAAETWLAARAKEDGPWAAFVSFVSPHYPLTAPEAFYALYDPAEMDMPIAYDRTERPDHPELRNVTGFFDYDRYFSQDKIGPAKAAYYGLTTFMDHCVGRVLAALEASGQADDTLVIYASDHGDMMGDHGIWTKQVMYEASAGVPLIIAGPGAPQGARVATGASLVDLAATARDVAGLAPLESAPGRSLRALAREPSDPDRTIFSEYHDGGSTTATFMVRWDRWKYVDYVGFRPQLFDLQADPEERRDLAAEADPSPRATAALAEGRQRLTAICDPEAVNSACFADQRRRIELLGGEEACRNAAVFNHTPAPTAASSTN